MNNKRLKEIARSLLPFDKGALLEDGISVCEFLERRFGVNLTVKQGGKVRDMMDEMQNPSQKKH